MVMESIERTEPDMRELTVLCVDADEHERDAMRDALEADGADILLEAAAVASAVDGAGADDSVRVLDAASVAEAAESLAGDGVDCVVTAYSLPDGTGLDVAARVRDTTPDTPCILFTDESPERIDTMAHENVVVEYLPRDMPEAHEALARLVGNVVSQRSQVGYPLPTREDERLAAVEQYDRPGMEASDAFDRLTALARSHFGVDVAFLGLIDAHQERFLSCAGAGWETLSREDSMCTHTILQDDLLVVEDTHQDSRFADNDRLDELNIRAYAGVPLETPRGTTIGAFCLTHDVPRTFSEAELTNLQRYADEAMEQLELRLQLNKCRSGEAAEGIGTGDGDGGGPS